MTLKAASGSGKASADAPKGQPPSSRLNMDQIPLLHQRYTRQFVEALKTSTLEEGGPSPKIIHRLKHPEQAPLVLNDPNVKLSLELLMSTSGSSQQTYRDAREAVMCRHPKDKILSYEQCEKELARLTGVHAVEYDMCHKSCAVFVGPWKDLTHCPECGDPRYNAAKSAEKGKPVPWQHLIHTPPALQTQAMHRSPATSAAMQYFAHESARTKERLGPDSVLDRLNNIMHGQAFIQAIRDGKISKDDVVVASAMDGAQLYQSKESDCWFLIWIIYSLGPDLRYKKKYVLVNTIIPGKDKPVHMYSFMFVTLQNITAIMHMNNGPGMPIWSAAEQRLYLAKLFMVCNLADAPGMATVNGLVRHTGARGCRLFCKMLGRRKPGGTAYYPALLRPHNYNVEGCNHNHVNPSAINLGSEAKYWEGVKSVERCKTEAKYERVRKATGISKRSIFDGLPTQNILGIPGMFPLDLMHMLCLNLVALLVELWTGNIKCDETNNKESWEWCVLRGKAWTEHGERVEQCGSCTPGSHDCVPRNIAEKLNSGYKAKEHQSHLYVYCPGLLYGVLPFKYWVHLCKLVRAVRILHQKSVKCVDLERAHVLLLEFVIKFEVLYVQFRYNRLHFVRPALHTLVHMVPKSFHIGPLRLVGQWTMERAIGILTQQIRQDSNPYMNVSFQALCMSQTNTLKILALELDADTRREAAANRSRDCDNGYALLQQHERTAHTLTTAETLVVDAFISTHGGSWPSKKLCQWARARLPNQQVVCSRWKEDAGPDSWRAASSVWVSVCTV
jgi:hypothetical protein